MDLKEMRYETVTELISSGLGSVAGCCILDNKTVWLRKRWGISCSAKKPLFYAVAVWISFVS
jgi:hypothetical protein